MRNRMRSGYSAAVAALLLLAVATPGLSTAFTGALISSAKTTALAAPPN